MFDLRALALACCLAPSLLGCGEPQTCDGCAETSASGSSSETAAGTSETGTSETGTSETGTSETGTSETGTSETGELGACAGDSPIVVLETNMGIMVVQLDAVRAPITVENFVTYVATGFYDGTIFHRVVNGFVIQGGGYEPGLLLKPTMGPIPLEIHPQLRHVDGAIAMARSQAPDTAESQFYITDGAQPGLDDNYAVFGVLIDGFPVRNDISSVATHTVPWMGFDLEKVPVEDVVVESAYCVEAWP